MFNLASVYWRAIGNGHQSIECLRLAIHYAPYNARDIGYIGLANVLHRHGYLDSAMVIARAALDIRPDSVNKCGCGHESFFVAYRSLYSGWSLPNKWQSCGY